MQGSCSVEEVYREELLLLQALTALDTVGDCNAVAAAGHANHRAPAVADGGRLLPVRGYDLDRGGQARNRRRAVKKRAEAKRCCISCYQMAMVIRKEFKA